MRVIAGTARGRRLVGPEGTDTRPTSDRVREAVFNAVYSLGGVAGARVLDLYAGTGAMGIEALSRGAAEVVFVEQSRSALVALRANLEAAEVADRAIVVPAAVDRYLLGATGSFDVAVVDPPYSFDDWSELLPRIPAELIVIESGHAVELPAGWETHRVKRYGSTVVTLASPDRAGPDPAGSPTS